MLLFFISKIPFSYSFFKMGHVRDIFSSRIVFSIIEYLSKMCKFYLYLIMHRGMKGRGIAAHTFLTSAPDGAKCSVVFVLWTSYWRRKVQEENPCPCREQNLGHLAHSYL
jgi:hypothetical protein